MVLDMPGRWVHEGFDIISFGRSYWRLHKSKDAAWEVLGRSHRAVEHPWYPLFKALESLAPFPQSILAKTRHVRETDGPDKAEEFQVRVSHDYLDRWWDDLSQEERRRVAEVLRGALLDPQFLLKWADVDVIRGLVKVRYDLEYGYPDPIERWEPEPSLPRDYQNLKQFLEVRTVNDLLYEE